VITIRGKESLITDQFLSLEDLEAGVLRATEFFGFEAQDADHDRELFNGRSGDDGNILSRSIARRFDGAGMGIEF
jgi:hypothetical protein